MDDSPQNIEYQDISDTIVIDANNIGYGRIKINVEGYPLKEEDFETLVQPGAGFFEWSRRLLLIVIGSIVILLAKMIQFISDFNATENKNDVTLKVEKFEWIAISIALGLCLLLYICGIFFKNRKEKLIQKIKKHYKLAKDE